jgi:hypothetical protein
MSRSILAACLIFGCTTFRPLAAGAQQFGSVETLYSDGVQAYFGGHCGEAESLFSSVAGMDPNDPRAFYFRALSLMRQGREDEARSDMEIGAEIEARFPARFDIGKTLERVQGSNRLLLERYRRQARQAALANPPVGAVRTPDAGVLRERRIVPLDEFSREGVPQSFVAPHAPPQTFAAPAPTTNPPTAAPTAPATAAPPANPFNDDMTAPASKPQPKAPPAKAAPKTPPAAAPIPPAPKATTPPAPKPSDEKENPFL